MKPNKYVEQWAARREAVEFGFKFTPKSVFSIAVVGFAVPAMIYYGVCNEFVSIKCFLLVKEVTSW